MRILVSEVTHCCISDFGDPAEPRAREIAGLSVTPHRQSPLGSTQGTYAGFVCNSTISLYVPPVDIRDSCVPTSVTRPS